jgi:hypothetical protein
MKNLVWYPHDGFTAFIDAVGRKTDLAAKWRLTAAFGTIQPKFINYDLLFMSNELEELLDDGVHTPIINDLQSLYAADNALVGVIRKTVESLQSRSLRYTCQYCTLESSATMDHVVPQSEFPVFAIHPKNLIPSCNSCNQYKGTRWRVGTHRDLINFYTDQLPNYRYLHAVIFEDEFGDIDFKYRLSYPPGLNWSFYQLVIRHFSKLHLLERMRKGAIKHLTEFEGLIRLLYIKGETRAELTVTIMENCTSLRNDLGLNHWKPTMMEALVTSDLFWDKLIQ